ncbi:hypothetical protein H9P43_007564 [Blastocladiella emersonii ATCC 22665]|nr:hypothetical protein H9P43_007564 [Blastocladiella emersonii ATCC 22665]
MSSSVSAVASLACTLVPTPCNDSADLLPALHIPSHIPPPTMSLFNNFANALENVLDEVQHEDQQSRATGTSAPLAAPTTNLNGRKKALLIGINYKGTRAELRGCINDVKNVSNFISQHGFSRENMLILTDDQDDPNRLPNKANIVSAMKWLARDARAGDSLFFHFSGHGAQVKDASGDEEDGHDEVLVPSDYEKVGMLLDDDINAIMVKPLPAGCKLHMIMDCCHSGTMADTMYTYTVDGELEIHAGQRKSRVREGLHKLKAAATAESTGEILGNLKAGLKLLLKDDGSDNEGAAPPAPTPAQLKTQQERSSEADVLVISGCKDDQTSADASIDSQATGAMSWALISTLTEAQSEITYAQLLKTMRKKLHGKYTQIPQMSTARPLDLNTKFCL